MKRYPGGSILSPEWKKLRCRILERAGNRCEQCKVPNGIVVFRSDGGGSSCWVDDSGDVFCSEGGSRLGSVFDDYCDLWPVREVMVVLTIAHLDHRPENNSEPNLKALCQRCHNALDRPHRMANAARTRRLKKASGDFFEQKKK